MDKATVIKQITKLLQSQSEKRIQKVVVIDGYKRFKFLRGWLHFDGEWLEVSSNNSCSMDVELDSIASIKPYSDHSNPHNVHMNVEIKIQDSKKEDMYGCDWCGEEHKEKDLEEIGGLGLCYKCASLARTHGLVEESVSV